MVISTSGRNLQGCRKYPHQPRFLALLGMTMGGILENLCFQKTSESLTLQDVWGFRSSTEYLFLLNLEWRNFLKLDFV
jgi:hypothetical protein